MDARIEKREKVKESEDLRVLSVKQRQTNIVSLGEQKRIYIYIYIYIRFRAVRERACFPNIFIGKQAIENKLSFY